MQQRDPFSWADDYNRQMTSLGAQNEQNAQNALMNMFAQEAARQRPWSDLPVDLAKQNNAGMNSLARSKELYDYKQANKPPAPVNKITDMIYRSAKGMGVDPILALAIADIETGGRFNPDAKNPTSTAYGLFQQLDKNWAQYGKGLNRASPEHQTQAGLLFIRDIIGSIQSAGKEVTPGMVYFGYQQGPGALRAVLRNPNAPVESVLGVKEARLNGARRGESAINFMNRWSREAQRRYDSHKAVRSKQQDDSLEDRLSALGFDTNQQKVTAPDGDEIEIVD